MDTPRIEKDKNEITKDKAFKIIREWGDDMEVRLFEDDFEAVQKEICMAVMKERLTFNSNEEVFIYNLKKPIKDQNGNVVISIIKMKETEMNNKKGITKHKDDIDTTAAMFQSYCTDSDDQEIPHGFLTRIMDRDQHIISAVILGFFVQAVPSAR